jgi:hypothetical protein
MFHTQTRQFISVAGPGRLLVVALIPVIAFMMMAHITIVGGTAASMTPAEIHDRAPQLLIVSCLWVLPAILAAIAFTRLATILGSSSMLRPLAAIGVVFLVAHVAAQVWVVWFVDSPTLADTSVYALTILLSLLGWWAVDLAALLTCLRLFQARLAPRAALVIGVLSGLLFVIEVAVYLPALVGSQELHDTIGLPPMLMPLLWAILGAILWKKGASDT